MNGDMPGPRGVLTGAGKLRGATVDLRFPALPLAQYSGAIVLATFL